MKTVKVRMVAGGGWGEIREVEISEVPESIPDLLSVVFELGQNDFQPKQHPSVSVGDVIEVEDGLTDVTPRLFLVCSIGFYRLSAEQWVEYSRMERQDRIMFAMSQRLSLRPVT